ncbi:MAG: XisI protein [Xenococcaceae cyanobacterium]
MDKLEKYRQIVQKIIENHAAYKPTYGDIETVQVCDLVHDNYLLIDIGWDRTGRVHAVDLHLRIKEDKIWVEWDGTENGVTEELLEAGVLQEDIVLGFYRPERRSTIDFSVAY